MASQVPSDEQRTAAVKALTERLLPKRDEYIGSISSAMSEHLRSAVVDLLIAASLEYAGKLPLYPFLFGSVAGVYPDIATDFDGYVSTLADVIDELFRSSKRGQQT